MKAALLLFSLAFFSPFARAQSAVVLRVEPAEVSKDIVVDNLDEHFEDVTSVVVTNNSTRTIQLVKQEVAGTQPRAWSYRAFDRISRATPYVRSASEQQGGRQIALPPGQSATYYVVLQPDGVTGTGSVQLRFSDLTLPGSVLATASVRTTLSRSRGVEEQEATEIENRTPTTVRLYPNPATDRFFVEAPRGTRVGRVEVTNTLGRKIKQFTGASGPEGYPIETLPDGLYLISIYDTAGKKLRTLRLLHRQFGA